MNLGDVSTLPTTLDGRQTAALFGVSYWGLLEQVKAGTCPVEPLHLGRKLRWPTAKVLRSLGITPDTGEAPSATDEAHATTGSVAHLAATPGGQHDEG